MSFFRYLNIIRSVVSLIKSCVPFQRRLSLMAIVTASYAHERELEIVFFLQKLFQYFSSIRIIFHHYSLYNSTHWSASKAFVSCSRLCFSLYKDFLVLMKLMVLIMITNLVVINSCSFIRHLYYLWCI